MFFIKLRGFLMKHLFTLIDGTSRVARKEQSSKFSNIYRLNLALRERTKNESGKFDPQIVFYYPGIGSAKRLDRVVAKVRAYGIDDIIKDAYVNIASNYFQGDKIYIFGFSRGAVAARLLSGFISNFGLLRPDYVDLLDYAWEYNNMDSDYITTHDFTHFVEERGYKINRRNDSDDLEIKQVDEDDYFIRKDIKIKFLGVFDAVPGFSNPEKTVIRDFSKGKLQPAPNVESAVHILAIDERRRLFEPLVWQINSKSKRKNNCKIEQIWMPGVHTDIGGGYQDNLLSNVSFLTMIDKINEYCDGVAFYESYLDEIFEETTSKSKPFVINKESIFPNFITNFIYKKNRQIKRISKAVHNEYCSNRIGIFNTIHPLYFKMHGTKQIVRKSFSNYSNLFIDNRNLDDILQTQFEKDSYLNYLFKFY
jgi:hypothetical protein